MLPRRAWNFFVKFFDTFFREKSLYFKIIKNIEKNLNRLSFSLIVKNWQKTFRILKKNILASLINIKISPRIKFSFVPGILLLFLFLLIFSASMLKDLGSLE